MKTIVHIPEGEKLLPVSTSNGEPTFPWKLHMVLEESERLGFTDIISWQGDNAFRVLDQKRFEQHVMTTYFKQTQYRSFQRQLNIYGFKRLKTGICNGSYVHPYFVRGKADMCCLMRRTKIKNKGLRRSEITMTAKSTENDSFANFHEVDRALLADQGNPSSNDCYSTVPILSNVADPKFTVLGENFSPVPIRKILSIDKSSQQHNFQCDESTKICHSTIDNRNPNNSTMTRLQQLFQQQHQVIDRQLQSKMRKPETLGKGNSHSNGTASNCILSSIGFTCTHLTHGIDMDLDLDTIFDDNIHQQEPVDSCKKSLFLSSSCGSNRMTHQC